MTRFYRLMLLSLAFIAVIHCQAPSQPQQATTPTPVTQTTSTEDPLARVTAPDPAANPCKKDPNPPVDAKRPLICIDDRDLANIVVRPDPASANHAAVVQWWTVSGTGTASIVWKESSGPSGMVSCSSGTGFCKAVVSANGPDHKYHYWVTVTQNGHSGTTKDPTIIIDPTMTHLLGAGATTTEPTQTQ